MPLSEPTIRQLPERLVACLEYTGNYIGNTALFERLFTQLGNWAGEKGLMSPDTVFMSSYVNDPRTTPPDELRLDVCMNITESTEVDGAIMRKLLPGGAYAVMRAEITSPEEYKVAWMALVEWAENNNHPSDLSRPSYEIYLNNPEQHPKKHHIVDICLSVNTYA